MGSMPRDKRHEGMCKFSNSEMETRRADDLPATAAQKYVVVTGDSTDFPFGAILNCKRDTRHSPACIGALLDRTVDNESAMSEKHD